jgi:predicted GNAT family acetyltransferase
MEYKPYNNVDQFRDKVKAFLEQEEVVNNLPLGILQNLANDNSLNTNNSEPLLALVEDEGGIILVLLMTPPYNVYVYGTGPKLEDAIKLAVSEISSINIDLPGVIGPRDVADLFAKFWSSEKDVNPTVKMNQRIYQLEKVGIEPRSPGKLRQANQNDVSLIAKWMHEFSNVTFGDLTIDVCLTRAKKAIDQGTFYLWQDNEKVVSMVNKTRPTENGITVNFVYTPPKYQRRGYATSCVAAFSLLLLEEGYKYCTLYTDLDNPTSNSIYMKIGYVPIRDSVMYQFK